MNDKIDALIEYLRYKEGDPIDLHGDEIDLIIEALEYYKEPVIGN